MINLTESLSHHHEAVSKRTIRLLIMLWSGLEDDHYEMKIQMMMIIKLSDDKNYDDDDIDTYHLFAPLLISIG